MKGRRIPFMSQSLLSYDGFTGKSKAFYLRRELQGVGVNLYCLVMDLQVKVKHFI